MNKTICKTCVHAMPRYYPYLGLDWQGATCKRTQKVSRNYVTGVDKVSYTTCFIINTEGECDNYELLPPEELKSSSFWSKLWPFKIKEWKR